MRFFFDFSCTVKIFALYLHSQSGNMVATFKNYCGNSSVGRAQPCQGWGREFESRFPLKMKKTARRCLFFVLYLAKISFARATPHSPFRGWGCKYKFARNCPRASWARVSFSAACGFDTPLQSYFSFQSYYRIRRLTKSLNCHRVSPSVISCYTTHHLFFNRQRFGQYKILKLLFSKKLPKFVGEDSLSVALIRFRLLVNGNLIYGVSLCIVINPIIKRHIK